MDSRFVRYGVVLANILRLRMLINGLRGTRLGAELSHAMAPMCAKEPGILRNRCLYPAEVMKRTRTNRSYGLIPDAQRPTSYLKSGMRNDKITLYIPHSSIVPSGAVLLTDVIDKRTRSSECHVDGENAK